MISYLQNVHVGSGSGRIRISGSRICGSGSERNIYGSTTFEAPTHRCWFALLCDSDVDRLVVIRKIFLGSEMK